MSTFEKTVCINPPGYVIFYDVKGEEGEPPQLIASTVVKNESAGHIMFKVKTTNQDNYYVRPNLGIVGPKETRTV